MLDPAPDATHFSTKPDTDSKYAIIHKLSSKVPWYKDPFAGTSNPRSSAVSPTYGSLESFIVRMRDSMLSLILTIKDSGHFPYAAIKAAVKPQ
jgi:hypothetical protein